ncbi:MAG: hypothetical protein NXI32_31285, partial [bacterium]|nr:hypothetical protein [bacterium]
MKPAVKERSRNAPNRVWFVLFTLSMITPAAPVLAAFEFSWRPQLRLGTRATDNLRTSINDPEAAWGFDMGGGVQLEAESATLRSRITPAFNFRRFPIGEGADADEYEVRTSTQWAFAERVTASLNFDYIRDSTLSTELTDTGRQTAVANRDTINVAPSLDVMLTDKTRATLGFYYSDVQFEQLGGTPFSDYDFKQVNVTITHSLSDRFSIFANGYVSEFRTPSRGGKSLTYGGLGGANYLYSATLDGDFAVGYVQSEIDFQTQQFDQFQLVVEPTTGQLVLVPTFVLIEDSATENGPIARANVRKKWSALLRGELSYARSVSPTVFGAQSATDDILATVYRDLTSRLVAVFRGRYNMRSAETDAITGSRGN